MITNYMEIHDMNKKTSHCSFTPVIIFIFISIYHFLVSNVTDIFTKKKVTNRSKKKQVHAASNRNCIFFFLNTCTLGCENKFSINGMIINIRKEMIYQFSTLVSK